MLGDSYQSFARLGLSFQRSQNGGRFSPQPGPSVSYYKRLQSLVDAPAKEKTFFDGIDTTVPGLYRALRKNAPAGAEGPLAAVDREIQAAFGAFSFNDPSAAAPPLARALAATRAALGQPGTDPDVTFMLGVKERQIADAIHAALGISLTAIAQPANTPEATGPVQRWPSRDATGRPRADLRGPHGVREPQRVRGYAAALRSLDQRHQIGLGDRRPGSAVRSGRAEPADRPEAHRVGPGERDAHAAAFLPLIDSGGAIYRR